MTPDEYCQQKAAAKRLELLLQLPVPAAPQRRAITALYAFCREVDDVVDEVTTRRRAHQARVVAAGDRACVRRQRAASGCAGAHAGRARICAAARALRDRDRRHGDGPGTGTLRRFRGARAVLPSRGRAWSGLMSAEIFGYTDPRHAATRATWASRSSSPTSAATSARTRAAATSTCRRRTSRASASRPPRCCAEAGDGFRALMAFEVERAQAWYAKAFDQLPAADRKAQRAGS